MKVRLAGETRIGRAIDLRDVDVDATTVVDAIRGENGDDPTVAIDCPDPGPVHEHVGVIRAEMDLSLRPALAAAARSRGRTAPQADELAAVRDRLDALDVSEIDLERARRRVADASDAAEELRERVATLRGRVQALREASAGTAVDMDAAETELEDATRRLSEVETERIAAEQALARARERARANRERRRERLRLADRESNLRRAARERLADGMRDAFADARDAVPDGASVGGPVETALAVARAAEMDAPVVLVRGVDSFGSVEEASRWLDTPVVGL
ncbi:DUF7856 family protein [Halorussus salinisoli]|uniref:DUF7856 family protein n=1 Tax=Halorussus salinisoli TaxID=2558242 RepID=UPI0010C208D3|nr:hypothetical protein [Halorussus salinisoli]